MRTTRVFGANCAKCGKLLDAANDPKNEVPAPGDVTLCFFCGELYQFERLAGAAALLAEPAPLTLRPVTFAELEALPPGSIDLDLLRKLRREIGKRRTN